MNACSAVQNHKATSNKNGLSQNGYGVPKSSPGHKSSPGRKNRVPKSSPGQKSSPKIEPRPCDKGFKKPRGIDFDMVPPLHPLPSV